MLTHEQLVSNWMQDSEFQEEYEKLREEFEELERKLQATQNFWLGAVSSDDRATSS